MATLTWLKKQSCNEKRLHISKLLVHQLKGPKSPPYTKIIGGIICQVPPQSKWGQRKDVGCHAGQEEHSWPQEEANLASGSNYVNCARAFLHCARTFVHVWWGHLREVGHYPGGGAMWGSGVAWDRKSCHTSLPNPCFGLPSAHIPNQPLPSFLFSENIIANIQYEVHVDIVAPIHPSIPPMYQPTKSLIISSQNIELTWFRVTEVFLKCYRGLSGQTTSHILRPCLVFGPPTFLNVVHFPRNPVFLPSASATASATATRWRNTSSASGQGNSIAWRKFAHTRGAPGCDMCLLNIR